MTDRPIVFRAPMICALRDGRKTQTRRVLANVPLPCGDTIHAAHLGGKLHPSPYLDSYCSEPKTTANPRGMSDRWCWWTRDNRPAETFEIGWKPGDRLWVRERMCFDFQPERTLSTYEADGQRVQWGNRAQATWLAEYPRRKSPSIHMPRWASRATLIVTDVRVQRVQNIGEEDAIAEGVERLRSGRGFYDPTLSRSASRAAVRVGRWFKNAPTAFSVLWDSIHGVRGADAFDENPWVAAITFRTILANIDAPEARAA